MNDYIDKIKVRGTTYDVADTDGRAAIAPDYADLTFRFSKRDRRNHSLLLGRQFDGGRRWVCDAA